MSPVWRVLNSPMVACRQTAAAKALLEAVCPPPTDGRDAERLPAEGGALPLVQAHVVKSLFAWAVAGVAVKEQDAAAAAAQAAAGWEVIATVLSSPRLLADQALPASLLTAAAAALQRGAAPAAALEHVCRFVELAAGPGREALHPSLEHAAALAEAALRGVRGAAEQQAVWRRLAEHSVRLLLVS